MNKIETWNYGKLDQKRKKKGRTDLKMSAKITKGQQEKEEEDDQTPVLQL